MASTDTELSTEEVRERVDEFQERTEEGREQADEVRETAEEVRETAEDTLHRDDHESSGELDDEELPGEDRSLEEIEERAEENVQEKPAQPGEMTVEEDVVADIVDEESATEGDDQESA